MLPTILDQLQALNAANPARAGSTSRQPRLRADSGSATVLRALYASPRSTQLDLVRRLDLPYETVQACLRNAREKQWVATTIYTPPRGKQKLAHFLTPLGVDVLRHNFPKDFPDAKA